MMHEGSAVVVGEFGIPRAAIEVLRAAHEVHEAPDVPEDLLERAASAPLVLLCADGNSEPAKAMRAAGAAVYGPVTGESVLGAIAVMDRLRSPGGCPWDAVQTHDSLRRYLVEETYELLEAIECDDRAELREELGDVLLQVLFHARVAKEDRADPFDIDEVAGRLVDKLVGRHPHVFGDGERLADAQAQQVNWDKLKQREKRRESTVDGVALGQPAAALAGKLASRVARVGFPERLYAEEDELFAAVARIAASGRDPEGELRAAAKRFAERVRETESLAREAGAELTEQAWSRYWVHGDHTPSSGDRP